MAMETISGRDGDIAWLVGTSTPVGASEACADIGKLPGGKRSYPVKQIYQVTDVTKHVLDPGLPVVVSNGGVPVKRTDYKLLHLNGCILFRQPLTGTPVITVAGNYIPATTGTDVIPVEHVNDWSLGLTANEIDLDEYATDIIPAAPGKFQGTFQFMRHSAGSGIDLLSEMLLQKTFIFSLYEEVQTKRRWNVYGRLGGAPMAAPSAGAVSGTVTGRCLVMPAFDLG
jgi:hypothetical protein